MIKILNIAFLTVFSLAVGAQSIWSVEKANIWQKQYPYLAGANYIPASAINQLEMWQEATFDPKQIDKELSWAASIGFNFMRVFLHEVAWQQDKEGFKKRINTFLDLCDKYKIKVMFVFFDDCWYGNPTPGKQDEPTPGLHNSYWLQSPSFAVKKDSTLWAPLEAYVKDILSTYAQNKTIILWDLYNEPGNNEFFDESLPLLQTIFRWARSVNPSQPLTAGVWQIGDIRFRKVTNFQLLNSDVISFHNYGKYEDMKKDISKYKSFGRPVVCSEYLARGYNSTFETHLPLLKKENVAAINWGLVYGKTQTIFPWDTPLNAKEPEIWHHDIFWSDGKPFKQSEIDFIKKTLNKK